MGLKIAFLSGISQDSGAAIVNTEYDLIGMLHGAQLKRSDGLHETSRGFVR